MSRCELCSNEINLLCDGHMAIENNVFVCTACVTIIKTDILKTEIWRKVDEKRKANHTINLMLSRMEDKND